jgi:hypothetical protein
VVSLLPHGVLELLTLAVGEDLVAGGLPNVYGCRSQTDEF